MLIEIKHVIAILLLMAVLVLILPYLRNQTESFLDMKNPYAVELDDYSKMNRDAYIQFGKQRYNRFGDNQDMFGPGLRDADLASEQAQLIALNNGLKEATNTTGLTPSTESKTLLGVQQEQTRDGVAPPSAILKEARKCERNLTRDACSILGKPETARCGVCIKGGTDSFKTTPEKHIGGMLSLEPTRQIAIQTAEGGKPVHQPTVGTCPPGFFFVDKEECIKEVNRLNCKESGLTGGFNGVTIEGKRIAKETCANCLVAGDTTYLYEPKHRSFPVQFRFLSPAGTGLTVVQVAKENGVLLGEKRLQAGIPDILVLDATRSVKEGEVLRITVFQEFPHRPRGQEEVFLVTPGSGNGYTRSEAANKCVSLGARIATSAQLEQTVASGGQVCAAGHSNTTTGYPMQANKSGCGTQGLNLVNQDRAGAWCSGIKPPVERAQSSFFDTVVRPFFDASLGIPQQQNIPTKKSAFGDDYEAPFYRGIVIQWESVNTAVPRKAMVEPSIIRVMGQNPENIARDGTGTFKVLRRMGTYAASEMIASPKPTGNGGISPSAFWIWNNLRESNMFTFDVRVPGILTDPFYPEDIPSCPAGPLIGTKDTLNNLVPSPCSTDGQVPGTFGLECITSLFRSAGGDPDKGTLSPLVNPENMNTILFETKQGVKTPRTEDQILFFLEGFYKLATTGKDVNGVTPGSMAMEKRQIINNAAMKMFGFELLSPCDDIDEDAQGNVLVKPKLGPFASDCLDFLYLNAGKDTDRTEDYTSGKKSVFATYSSLADRYSGIRQSELASKEAKTAHPLQACQRVGTLAPVNPQGAANIQAIQEANSRGIYVEDIQKYYNSVHRAANKVFRPGQITSADESDAQATAMMKCYGIRKMDDTENPTKCGIMARYVRVLRSMSIPWSQNSTPPIRIGSLEVYSSKDETTDLAFKKPTTASTVWVGSKDVPVQGRKVIGGFDGYISQTLPLLSNGTPNTEEEGNQFWMVDLESDVEIRKIIYYNIAEWRIEESKPYMADGQIVQLLDSNKKLIVQKTIGGGKFAEPQHGMKQELVFHTLDLQSPLPTGMIVSGKHILLETSAWDGMYIGPNVNSSSPSEEVNAISVQPEMTYSETYMYDTQKIRLRLDRANESFYIHSALATPNMRGFCLTYTPDGTVRFKPKTEGDFKSMWVFRPALNGAPGCLSIQNRGSPGLYLCMSRGAPRTPNYIVTVEQINKNSPLRDLARASWRVRDRV